MKCAACEQEMIERITELDLRIENKLYIVNNVKLEECQNCGEKVINPAISEEIFNMIKSHKYKLKTLSLPVVELQSS
ncbi:MAG: YgiT-type zinc finger protein [Candidatus Scalindua sp.]|nr:YgiT-type zinc finger protein [Candidatus Scalindua sp.]